MQSRLIFQLFKYSVYVLLSLNILFFFQQEHAAASVRFSNGIGALEFFSAYAATIDTAAWVVLLLMFELETFVLSDEQFTPTVNLALRSAATLSFAVIAFAFFGYLQVASAVHEMTPEPAIADLCDIADEGQSYAVNDAEFKTVTSDNCNGISAAPPFYRFAESGALVDAAGATEIQRLAWVDLINAGVWILIVILLQIDVWLQEKQRLVGTAFRASLAAKSLLYPILFLAAIYWGVKGTFVDFWDAFLWLVAFLFIENNVLEWRREEMEESTT